MNEAEAKAWLDVPRETLGRLEAFVELLRVENERQNLVSRASLEHVWSRHIIDSAQLARFARSADEAWLDLGSGAGFPGLIAALLHPGPFTLVESRKLRVDFLARARETLALGERVEIVCSKLEAVEPRRFEVISARAFAPLGRLFELGERFAASTTRWVLPKGRNAKSELEAVESLWQGEFRLEPSVTDPDAQIIVAEQVRRRERGKRRR
jgi:16S rRNA (guanine527-N7)-methyltransferase